MSVGFLRLSVFWVLFDYVSGFSLTASVLGFFYHVSGFSLTVSVLGFL